MPRETMRLTEPTIELASEFLEMADEFRAIDDGRYAAAFKDFGAYVHLLMRHARGEDLPKGFVPYSTHWLVRDDNRVFGTARLRYTLVPALEKEGGHIGYDIRPSERRKGYGTQLLALMLNKARERGLTRALVTCDADNIASARIIEANGGKYEGASVSDRSGNEVSRYWIELGNSTQDNSSSE